MRRYSFIFALTFLAACAKPPTDSPSVAPDAGALASTEMQGKFEKSEDVADLSVDAKFQKDCPKPDEDAPADVIDERLGSSSAFDIKTKVSTFNTTSSTVHSVTHHRALSKTSAGTLQFKIDVSEADGYATAKIPVKAGASFNGTCQNHTGSEAGVYCTSPYFNFLDGADFDRSQETGCRLLKDPGDGKTAKAAHGYFTFQNGQKLEAWAEVRTQALAAVCPKHDGQTYFGTRRVLNVWVKSLANPQILKACSTRVFRLSEDKISGYAALKSPLLMKKSEEVVGFNY